MVKRALLVITFIAALGAAGLATGSKAMAWSDYSRNVAAYPYAYPTYAGYVGYNSFAPRVAYYPTYPVRSYPAFYGRSYDRHRQHHHDNGLTISLGF